MELNISRGRRIVILVTGLSVLGVLTAWSADAYLGLGACWTSTCELRRIETRKDAEAAWEHAADALENRLRLARSIYQKAAEGADRINRPVNDRIAELANIVDAMPGNFLLIGMGQPTAMELNSLLNLRNQRKAQFASATAALKKAIDAATDAGRFPPPRARQDLADFINAGSALMDGIRESLRLSADAGFISAGDAASFKRSARRSSTSLVHALLDYRVFAAKAGENGPVFGRRSTMEDALAVPTEEDLQNLRGSTLSTGAKSRLAQASVGKPKPIDVRTRLLEDANLRIASETEANAARAQLLEREAASILERDEAWRRSRPELKPPPQAPVPIVGANFDSTADKVPPGHRMSNGQAAAADILESL